MKSDKKVVTVVARGAAWSLLGALLLGALPQAALAQTEAQVEAQVEAQAKKPTPTPISKIAFVSTRDGSSDIYSMNPDGSGQTRLTNDEFSEVTPQFSPDGRRLVYSANPQGFDGNMDLFVIKDNGDKPKQLTKTDDVELDPEWSPDGKEIAYTLYQNTSDGSTGPEQIYITDAKGKETRQLTYVPLGAWQPTWSPDGSRLAFVSAYDAQDRTGRYLAIFTVNADGTDVQFVIGGQNFGANGPFGVISAPTWSPNGARIAFAAGNTGRGGASTQIYEVNVNANGSGNIGSLRRVTNLNGGFINSPSYSPDGTRIAFSTSSGSNDIFTINRSGTGLGTGLQQLTSNPAVDSDPSWSRAFTPKK